jgi:hypothetical protein
VSSKKTKNKCESKKKKKNQNQNQNQIAHHTREPQPESTHQAEHHRHENHTERNERRACAIHNLETKALAVRPHWVKAAPGSVKAKLQEADQGRRRVGHHPERDRGHNTGKQVPCQPAARVEYCSGDMGDASARWWQPARSNTQAMRCTDNLERGRHEEKGEKKKKKKKKTML